MIGSGIFHYIYHIGCAFNLHSVINNGLIPGGQDLSRRQTVFFLPIDPRDENHKDPEHIDFSVPRLARYMHSAWKRHQDTVFWVDIDLVRPCSVSLRGACRARFHRRWWSKARLACKTIRLIVIDRTCANFPVCCQLTTPRSAPQHSKTASSNSGGLLPKTRWYALYPLSLFFLACPH